MAGPSAATSRRRPSAPDRAPSHSPAQVRRRGVRPFARPGGYALHWGARPALSNDHGATMKKIDLSKQTLRVLTAQETEHVAGAAAISTPIPCAPETRIRPCGPESRVVLCPVPSRVRPCPITQGPEICPL